MSAYTAPDQIEKYLPLDVDGLVFDEPLYVQIIGDWSGYVDDYLSNVYKTPFPDYPNAPQMIKVAVELLCIYDIYVRSGMASDKDDPRLNLWKRAHEILDRIRNKDVVLSGTDQIGSGIEDTHAVIVTGPGKGPLSFEAQSRGLGPPHARSWGGIPLKTAEDEEL